MPELLFFVPCGRSIIDKENDVLSLIDVLDTINFAIPADQEIQDDAMASFPWQAVALWRRRSDEGDQQFEQKFELVLPDGRVQNPDLAVRIPFAADILNCRVTLRGDGFPIAQKGLCFFKVYTRAVDETEWHLAKEYPLLVNHVAPQD